MGPEHIFLYNWTIKTFTSEILFNNTDWLYHKYLNKLADATV